MTFLYAFIMQCLKGDGQIDVESDEAAVAGAKAYASRKKAKVVGKAGGGGLQHDPSFIGVMLSSQGRPERVFLEG